MDANSIFIGLVALITFPTFMYIVMELLTQYEEKDGIRSHHAYPRVR